MLGQMIRYGFAGGLATLIYSSVYLPLAWWIFPGERAVLAVPFAFTTALCAGFFLHSHFSFAGHGTRENSGRQHGKFLIVHRGPRRAGLGAAAAQRDGHAARDLPAPAPMGVRVNCRGVNQNFKARIADPA